MAPPSAGVTGGGTQGRVSGAGESHPVNFIPGFSTGTCQHVEYVSRLVPRGPRSSVKRSLGDDSSTSAPASKKSRQSGVPIIGSMLLGEDIVSSCLGLFVFVVIRFLASFRWKTRCSRRG